MSKNLNHQHTCEVCSVIIPEGKAFGVTGIENKKVFNYTCCRTCLSSGQKPEGLSND